MRYGPRNVAETSITIDDIGLVLDTARMKEMRYDAARHLSSLEDVAVARSNLNQRRGRAGRVAEGVAVHLITRYRHDHYYSPCVGKKCNGRQGEGGR